MANPPFAPAASAAAPDDRLERHETFLRRHVLPRLTGWRLRQNTLHRNPIGEFLCTVSIDLDDPHRVVGRAEAGALFTGGLSAGFKTWQPRATKLEARVNAVLGIVARAGQFLAPYATPLTAARWLATHPDLDPMEGEVTALTWALAGRPREALKALSRASEYGDTLQEEHLREFNRPILDDIARLRRDLEGRPVAVRKSLRRQVRRQLAEYRTHGVI
jgi:hypothetical protein